jgi:hypothetical protein
MMSADSLFGMWLIIYKLLLKLCWELATRHAGMEHFMEMGTITEVRQHFVNGQDDIWKAFIGSGVQERLWEACTSHICDLLELGPSAKDRHHYAAILAAGTTRLQSHLGARFL